MISKSVKLFVKMPFLIVISMFFRVTFTFKTSKKSNNGTDVNAGQIPEILYRVMVPDVLSSVKSRKTSVNFALSASFSKTITQVSHRHSVY